MKEFYIYILTNNHNTTFYIGITNDLYGRYQEHKEKINIGFTYKYNLEKLIYYEPYPTAEDAIRREKQLKNWHRDWKLNLIRSINPELRDLSLELFGDSETMGSTSSPQCSE